jgi:hypothetical protein
MRKIYTGSSSTISKICIAAFAFIALFITSCEKEVKINLDNGESRLVVEGAIETGLPPYVILTKSVGYFAKIDLNTLQNSFVHDAEVTVSDGVNSVRLIEYSIDTGLNNRFSFYSIDTSKRPFMIGEVEKYYKLTIKLKDKPDVYEAITKIPRPTSLDSVVTYVPTNSSQENSFRRRIQVFFKDPDTLGNYVRYFTQRNDEPYYAGLNGAYSDEVINGTQFQTILAAGESRGSTKGFDSLGYFYPGDKVTLKWCATDKAVYDFYSTYEYALGTLGNPFASPIQVKTNISNNGLGIWAGYGSIYTTLVIQ